MSKCFLETSQITQELVDQMNQRSKHFEVLDQSKKDPKLNFGSYRACLYFDQPSTRTRHSFIAALQFLGISYSDFGDTRRSSMEKGESIQDTFKTLFTYYDIVILRTSDESVLDVAHVVAKSHQKTLINAGQGSKEHPTQALLDCVTLERERENHKLLRGSMSAIIVGDYDRGRAAKSFAMAYKNLGWGSIQVVGPAPLTKTSEYPVVPLSKALGEADIIYMTRLQSEYGGVSDAEFDYQDYALGPKEVSLLKPKAIVLHPLPRGKEIPEPFDTDSRAYYWKQEKVGFYTRAALIEALLL